METPSNPAYAAAKPAANPAELARCFAALDSAAAGADSASLLPDEFFQLGMALENGLYGLTPDHDRAVMLVTAAAHQGHPLACTAMARLHFTPGQLSALCVRYLRLGIGAGSVECAFRLGVAIVDRRADGQADEGVALVHKAAMRLLPSALGFMAFKSLEERPAKRTRARLYASLALLFGEQVVAQHLTDFFTPDDNGPDGNLNFDKAISTAAAAGEPLGIYARYMLAVSDADGRYKGESQQSEKLLRRAADAAVPDAMERMASQAAATGDFEAASRWLKRTLPLLMPESLFLSGLMAINGDGRTTDIAEGCRLASAACCFGLPSAQMLVSSLTANGSMPDPYGARADLYRLLALAPGQ